MRSWGTTCMVCDCIACLAFGQLAAVHAPLTLAFYRASLHMNAAAGWRGAQVNSEALQQACPVPFDEGRLWKGADSAELKAQLQRHFQNITKVMDCVGCEKCKLWGKLQMLGARPAAAHPIASG